MNIGIIANTMQEANRLMKKIIGQDINYAMFTKGYDIHGNTYWCGVPNYGMHEGWSNFSQIIIQEDLNNSDINFQAMINDDVPEEYKILYVSLEV